MPRKRNGNGPSTDTRERIADAAVALFNSEGWHAVSTRHIAARLDISPGNLYYHFANKEEIALRLYERLEVELDSVLAPPAGAYGSFDEVLAYLDAILGHLWKFRFFYRDLNSLLREVPGLKDKYRALAERVLGRARRIFAGMVDADWMEASEEQLDLLATNAWIILTQWFTHRQVMDRRRTIQSSDIRDGVRHLVALFSPLLRPPQRRQVQRLLDQPA
jgi:AcrR family transcriptional regulator